MDAFTINFCANNLTSFQFLLPNVKRQINLGIFFFADKRTNDWFLVGSPWTVISILAFYHYFVHKLGPALMQNRRPFNVDRLIQIYNASQVILCSWLVIEVSFHCIS